MKQIATLSLFVITLIGCGTQQKTTQATNSTTNYSPSPEYSKATVFAAPNKSKIDIYNGAKIWIASTFNSYKAVIDIDDKDLGILKGSGIFRLYPYENTDPKSYASAVLVEFQFCIYIKDGKYKVEYRKFEFKKDTKALLTFDWADGLTMDVGSTCPYGYWMTAQSKEFYDNQWIRLRQSIEMKLLSNNAELLTSVTDKNKLTDF